MRASPANSAATSWSTNCPFPPFHTVSVYPAFNAALYRVQHKEFQLVLARPQLTRQLVQVTVRLLVISVVPCVHACPVPAHLYPQIVMLFKMLAQIVQPGYYS